MSILAKSRCLVLLTLFFISPSLWAQQALPAENVVPPTAITAPDDATDIYMITGVQTDVTAANAAAARDKAIFDGQRAALGLLLTRLGAETVDTGAIPDNKIAAMVQDFEITQEKASTVRYIATLNVRFKPGPVQGYLTKAGVNYTTSPSKPVVILPVSTVNGRAVLWEERTPWRLACENLGHPDPMLPYVVPNGDLNDVSAISATDALAGSDKALNVIALNYNAGTVAVAQIALPTEKLDPAHNLAITVTRFDETGLKLTTDLLNIPPAADLAAQMNAGAQAVDKLLRKYWRQSNGNAPDDGSQPPPYSNAQNSLPVEAPIANLTALATLRQRLGSIPAIQNAETVSLTRGLANLRLDYNGDILQLQQALASQDLILAQLPGGVWQLRSR